MEYYLDAEFAEGPKNLKILGVRIPPWLIKPTWTIDLISIGLVSSDGREYYAVSKDFDLKHVWNKYDLLNPLEMGDASEKVYWLRENVLRPIHADLCKNISGDMKNTDYFHDLSTFSYRSLKRLISIYGKTNKQIVAEIKCFVAGTNFWDMSFHSQREVERELATRTKNNPPSFYGYFADYDWVLFCSLFGRMLDLPKGYPMYCRDLKQIMDNLELDKSWKDKTVPGDNEHHALADARWNRKLHKALQEFPAFLANQ